MNEYAFLLPEGSLTYTIEEVTTIRKLEEKLRIKFKNNEFKEVIVPSLEYTNFYTRMNGMFKIENLFQFVDYEGKNIAMRHDFTVPIARLHASHSVLQVAKYCYFGNIFRKQINHKGRVNEIYQAGIEIVDQGRINDDISCLNLIHESLQTLNITNGLIEIGYVPFLNRIFELVEDQERFKEILNYRSISKMKAYVSNYNYDNKFKKLLCLLPSAFGNQSIIEKIRKLCDDEILISCLDYLTNTIKDIKFEITVDFAMVPTMKYYSGIMFKCYLPEMPSAILNGGRYDHLYEFFNHQSCAIGFCFDLNQIAIALYKGGNPNA